MAEIKMPRLSSDLSPNIWLRSDIYSTWYPFECFLGPPFFLFLSFFIIRFDNWWLCWVSRSSTAAAEPTHGEHIQTGGGSQVRPLNCGRLSQCVLVESSIIQQQQHTQQKKKKAGRHQSRIDLTQVLWLYTVPGSEYIVHSINILQRVFYIYSRDQSIYDFNIVMVGLVFVYIYVCWKWTASLTFRSCSFVIFSGSLGVSNELDRRIAAVPVVRGDDIRWRRTRFSSTRVRQ